MKQTTPAYWPIIWLRWPTKTSFWLQIQRGTFRPLAWKLGEAYGPSLAVLSYLAGFKRVSARPTRIRWQIGPTALRALASSSSNKRSPPELIALNFLNAGQQFCQRPGCDHHYTYRHFIVYPSAGYHIATRHRHKAGWHKNGHEPKNYCKLA